jgi:nickel-dependent lactate racemase
MIYYQYGSENTVMSRSDLEYGVYAALVKIGQRKKILVIPPDFTRFHSRAGDITTLLYNYYRESLMDILPALGTHSPDRH